MNEWIKKQIGEIGYFKTSGVDKVIKADEKIVRLVNYMDVYRSVKIDNSFSLAETSATQHEIDFFDLKKGDVLFTPTSETPDDIGHSAVIIEDLENAVYSYHLTRFREFTEKVLDDEFKAYLFNQYFVLHQFEKKAAGTTRFTLTRGSFESTFVRFPKDKNVQIIIAKILSTTDAVIEKTKAAIAKYKAIKQGMLQDLFTRGIDTTTNQLRPPYQDAPHLYKESKLGMIPRGWEAEKIGKLFRFNQGVQCPVEMQKYFPIQNDVRFIRIIDLTNEKEPARYITDPGSQYHLKKDDLFMVRYGSPGLVGYGYEGVIANNLFRIINTGELEILNSFYKHYLTSIADKLAALSASTTMPAINFDSLNKLLVVYPEYNEQVEIEKRIQAIDNKLEIEQTYLQKMQSLKKGLMEDLLSGKRQVKVQEDLILQNDN